MASLLGTWGLESQEGFDEFMRHIGVGFLMRKMGNQLRPDFIVTKPAEDTWKMETVSTFKTTVVSFKVGEEFKETTADDRIVNATITFEGEKMIHNQVDPNDEKKNTIIERFVDPPGSDNLVTTVKCGDIVAKRVYKKKPDPATA